MLGVGVLDANPAGGLAAARFAPPVRLRGRCAVEVLRLLGRGNDLVGELVGQAPVALVNLSPHPRSLAELFGDALCAHGRLVMHPAGPFSTRPQGPALMVADRGRLA